MSLWLYTANDNFKTTNVLHFGINIGTNLNLNIELKWTLSVLEGNPLAKGNTLMGINMSPPCKTLCKFGGRGPESPNDLLELVLLNLALNHVD